MAGEKETKEVIEEESKGFDYKHKASFKVSDKFKAKFNTKTAGGGETMSADGLVALAHVKGMWKCETKIVQYPSADNGNVCICQATVGGYDWDPIEGQIIKVEYTDIGDASPQNCNRMVAPSFIRMASTRALGRVLRKYTNIDMLCTEELGDDDIATESMEDVATKMVEPQQLVTMKGVIQQKGIDKATFESMLMKTFNINDFQRLTFEQANTMIQILNNYVAPSK